MKVDNAHMYETLKHLQQVELMILKGLRRHVRGPAAIRYFGFTVAPRLAPFVIGIYSQDDDIVVFLQKTSTNS